MEDGILAVGVENHRKVGSSSPLGITWLIEILFASLAQEQFKLLFSSPEILFKNPTSFFLIPFIFLFQKCLPRKPKVANFCVWAPSGRRLGKGYQGATQVMVSLCLLGRPGRQPDKGS